MNTFFGARGSNSVLRAKGEQHASGGGVRRTRAAGIEAGAAAEHAALQQAVLVESEFRLRGVHGAVAARVFAAHIAGGSHALDRRIVAQYYCEGFGVEAFAAAPHGNAFQIAGAAFAVQHGAASDDLGRRNGAPAAGGGRAMRLNAHIGSQGQRVRV